MIFHHRQEIYDKLEEISSQINQIKIIKIKTKDLIEIILIIIVF
jgi:hypothetical protein